MDISKTIEAKSDQLNSDDLVGGPVTVTVSEVRKGTPDQPVELHTAEYPGKPFKPSKTVRRVLVAAWGANAEVYVGRRLTLFRDPTVKWAGEAIGGIRVSHMSHLDKPMKLSLAVSKGKRQVNTVQPLVEAAPQSEAIPADVVSNVEKAKKDGNLGSYLAWLQDNGAPEQIVAYVKDQEEA